MRIVCRAASIVRRTSASAPASGENALSMDGCAQAGSARQKARARELNIFFIFYVHIGK